MGAIGTILATSDGGAHWSAQRSGTSADLRSVSFVDASYGWAVGTTLDADYQVTGNVILATSNGGADWHPQYSGSAAGFNAVDFVDAAHGWVVGEGGTILATTDGGATGSVQDSGTTRPGAVAFLDPSHGWVGGGQGILATTTGGWPPAASAMPRNPRGCFGSQAQVTDVPDSPKRLEDPQPCALATTTSV